MDNWGGNSRMKQIIPAFCGGLVLIACRYEHESNDYAKHITTTNFSLLI